MHRVLNMKSILWAEANRRFCGYCEVFVEGGSILGFVFFFFSSGLTSSPPNCYGGLDRCGLKSQGKVVTVFILLKKKGSAVFKFWVLLLHARSCFRPA